MSKQTEALKLALEALEEMQAMANFECWNLDICDEALAAIREALAEQPAQIYPSLGTQVSRVWWDGDKLMAQPIPLEQFYKEPEQPAQQDMPKIGCVNHDCDKCKAQQQEPDYWLGYGLQAHTEKPFDGATPVWASPPASKPWVGLTEQERNDLEDYCEMIIGKAAFEAIEAKLREKNA